MLKISVPGSFRDGVSYLDLETRKVPTDGFRMPSGEPLRNRWSVLLAGIARDGAIVILEGTEAEILDGIGVETDESEIRYSATREFDEMICRGRFTNARRAHLPAPAFPAVPGAESREWRNLGRIPEQPLRGADVPSRDVPVAFSDGRRDAVLVHLLRDVVELILADGDPDEACRDWCEWILLNAEYALAKMA